MPEDYLEKRSMSLRQEGFDPYPAMGAYGLQYCSFAAPLSGILDFMPSGNPVLLAPNEQGSIFIDQITDDIYTYNQDDKPFILEGDIDRIQQHIYKNALKIKINND